MNRLMQRILLILLILIPLGCSDSTRSSESTSPNAALFDPTTNTIPLPNILATATAKDPITQYTNPVTGFVGLRPANTPMNPLEALAYENIYEVGGTNAVAGLNAPIYIRFTTSLDPATVNGANIKVFQVTPDSPLPTSTENNPLHFTDVTGMFSFVYSAGSSDVSLFPNFPLLPGTRYVYLVSNRVKDAVTGGAVSSSVYFDALKSTVALGGPFAALEPIRANVLVGGQIALSGYAKTMDDLIAASATTTVGSRNEIALIGRFITTTAGFVATDPANNPIASLIPVESALRAFAAGQLPGKLWDNTVAGTLSVPFTPQITVTTGTFTSADISTNPVGVHNNPNSIAVPFGKYSSASAVVQPFRDPASKKLIGFYYNNASSSNSSSDLKVPFIYFAPSTPAPPTGWPLVIFQHGINHHKEDAAAVAVSLCGAGFAVVAIDLPLHGALAVHDKTAPLSSPLWGQDFIALGAPLAARSNVQQAAFNLNRLEIVVKSGGFSALASKPDPAHFTNYVSLSLGSIVGAYYLAGNTTLSGPPPVNGDMKGLLSAAGGRIAYLLRDSVSFAPSINAGLAANNILPGTPKYNQFFLLTQTVLDSVDPATMTTPLPNLSGGAAFPSRLSGRILVQEATSTSPTTGDLVIPNSSTRYFGNALGGRGVLGTDIATGFSQLEYVDPNHLTSSFMFTLKDGAVVPKTAVAAHPGATTGPKEGYFQFDQPDVTHGFLIDQASSPTSFVLAQTQMVSWVLTGVAVDPTASPIALAKATISSAAGVPQEVKAPPVMRIFGNSGLR